MLVQDLGFSFQGLGLRCSPHILQSLIGIIVHPIILPTNDCEEKGQHPKFGFQSVGLRVRRTCATLPGGLTEALLNQRSKGLGFRRVLAKGSNPKTSQPLENPEALKPHTSNLRLNPHKP